MRVANPSMHADFTMNVYKIILKGEDKENNKSHNDKPFLLNNIHQLHLNQGAAIEDLPSNSKQSELEMCC